MKNKMIIPYTSKTIIGAVAGDVIGSIYEFNNYRKTDFPLFSANCKFTDDTVLTIAVADCILNKKSFAKTIWEYARNYPGRGYGGRFANWLKTIERKPYNSFGNGSAMRVSPVGFAYKNLEDVLFEAENSANVTHNHFEGIKGAKSVAAAIFLAKQGISKSEIKKYIENNFGYRFDFTIDSIKDTYEFDETCQGSVPQAFEAFFESNDFEHSIRLAVSVGGDSDTIACITGGIASAFYKNVSNEIIDKLNEILPEEFKKIILEFDEKFDN